MGNTTMRDSSLHIALSAKEGELCKDSQDKIKHTFESLFKDSSDLVSLVTVASDSELIYEIRTPIVHDESMTKEFFENLEVLLYELIDFDPHFTQYRRVDV